jgi:predicted esterase
MSLRPRFLFFALVLTATLRAAPTLPQGEVLAQVACASDANQTYALYVPRSFDPAKKSPVLFCFDPGARGRVPVERFKAAAEKFGWIVAGSNNSRNGPWEANAAAIKAMVGDVTRHLPIDAKRIYVAGLSGGARVACQIALGGLAQGVIACSAGFPASETPRKVGFAFFGTAGQTDFNHRELRRVDRELQDRRAVHRVVIFDGGHEWLPPALAVDALAWLELHAMRTGLRPADPTWIEQQWVARTAAVPAAPAVETWRALQAVVADFKGLAATDALDRRARDLAVSREVRAALKAERSADAKEESLIEELLAAAYEGTPSMVEKTIVDLQSKAKGNDAVARVMATRVIQAVASNCSEAAREAQRENDHERAASLLELAVRLRPERTRSYLDLARARALQGDKKATLAALERAAAAGFKDTSAVEREKAFDRWRSDAAFKAVLEKLR